MVYLTRLLPPPPPPPPPPAAEIQGLAYASNPTSVSMGRAAWISRGEDSTTSVAPAPRSTTKESRVREYDKENRKD